jgi:hypothetical protein
MMDFDDNDDDDDDDLVLLVVGRLCRCGRRGVSTRDFVVVIVVLDDECV